MLNQVIIVGRLVRDIELMEEDGKKYSNITVACPRAYKNENGEYDTDFIDVVIWNAIAENTAEYCKKGDIIGVKGRIQTEIVEDKKITRIIADRITFLSSNNKHTKEEEYEEL